MLSFFFGIKYDDLSGEKFFLLKTNLDDSSSSGHSPKSNSLPFRCITYKRALIVVSGISDIFELRPIMCHWNECYLLDSSKCNLAFWSSFHHSFKENSITGSLDHYFSTKKFHMAPDKKDTSKCGIRNSCSHRISILKIKIFTI